MFKKNILLFGLFHSVIHAMELQDAKYQPRTLKESCFKKCYDLKIKLPQEILEDFQNFKTEEKKQIREIVNEKLKKVRDSQDKFSAFEEVLDDLNKKKKYGAMECFIQKTPSWDKKDIDNWDKYSFYKSGKNNIILSKCLAALKKGDFKAAQIYQKNAYDSSYLPMRVLNANGIDLAHRRLIIKD